MLPWFNGTLVAFWQPITASDQASWRRTHILAHMVGGVVWDVVFHFLLLGTASRLWVVFPASAWWRLLGVGIVQLTFWEMIQRENWRPELVTPPSKTNTGYPWLSAFWDVVFTVLGAGLTELILWGMERLI